MKTFLETKFKKSERPTNTDNYRVAADIILQNIIAEQK